MGIQPEECQSAVGEGARFWGSIGNIRPLTGLSRGLSAPWEAAVLPLNYAREPDRF